MPFMSLYTYNDDLVDFRRGTDLYRIDNSSLTRQTPLNLIIHKYIPRHSSFCGRTHDYLRFSQNVYATQFDCTLIFNGFFLLVWNEFSSDLHPVHDVWCIIETSTPLISRSSPSVHNETPQD